MEIYHFFPWIYGVLIFSLIILIYIKVKAYEKLSTIMGKTSGLKGELTKYKAAPYLYQSEFKGDIQKALKIEKALNIVVVLILVFVGFTYIYYQLKFRGEI